MRWMVVVAVLALAGCTTEPPAAPAANTDVRLVDEEDAPQDEPEPAAAPEEPTPEETQEPPEKNALPVIVFGADSTSGEAPAKITFTIEASDEDGDDLSWRLDADGDGEVDAMGDEVPAEHAHTYHEAFGGHAILTVSDGKDETSSAVAIHIEEPEQEPEGGTSSGSTAGVTGLSFISPAAWEFKNAHDTLELTTDLGDPTQSVGYQVRIVAPDGSETNYLGVVNGDVLVYEPLLPGMYDAMIWPATAGSYEYTVDFCAHSGSGCP